MADACAYCEGPYHEPANTALCYRQGRERRHAAEAERDELQRVVNSLLFQLGGFRREIDQHAKTRAERDLLRAALEQSVALQSHYALILNAYDAGERLVFANAEEWLTRLATLADKAVR